ncbi:hypothetical protein [Rhizobium phage RHph_N46]|nr:hypothetical protein EVC12_233 [Rhizobium phage RHph_I42]QXV73918.1 hypothetical protein [Rhizobium phage RHph_N46]
MLSIKGLAKTRTVTFSNSGLALSYDNRGHNLTITLKGYDIAVPLDIDRLELPMLLKQLRDEARLGEVKLAAWENPDIRDLDKKISKAQRIALSYYIAMSYITNNEVGTRDIWVVFRDLHHSLISYLRHRSVATELLSRYKVAILSCHVKGYSIGDIPAIEDVFEACGLSRQNYIFYLLMMLDGMSSKIVFDMQDKFILSVDEFERETTEFIERKDTQKLCMYHVQRSLAFVVKSHKLSPSDLAHELSIATQTAYNIARPLRSKEYAENHARRAMTNMVNRIIQSYTKHASKVRLVEGAERSIATHVSLDATFGAWWDGSTFDPETSADVFLNTLAFSEDRMLAHIDSTRGVVAA